MAKTLDYMSLGHGLWLRQMDYISLGHDLRHLFEVNVIVCLAAHKRNSRVFGIAYIIRSTVCI